MKNRVIASQKSAASRMWAFGLSAALVVSVLSVGAPSPVSAAGAQPCATVFAPIEPALNGDEDFEIATPQNLVFLSENADQAILVGDPRQWREADFVQTADINLDGCLFTPIASTNFFMGTYDGADHTISHLHVDVTTTRAGLFGDVSNAVLQNINLQNVTVRTTVNDGAGALAGIVQNSTIANISIVNADIASPGPTGGAVGDLTSNSTLTDVTVSGRVEGSEDYGVGGAAGVVVDSDLTRVSSTAAVFGQDRVGGLVGDLAGATVESSSASGQVTSVIDDLDDTTAHIGGLIGQAVRTSRIAEVYNSSATGDVVVEIDGYEAFVNVGGLIGTADAETVRAYATGNITVDYVDNEDDGRARIGGLIGRKTENQGIFESYASGSVTVTGEGVVWFLGGLIGEIRHAVLIRDSYALGDVDARAVAGPDDPEGEVNAGGFIGESLDSVIERSFSAGSVLVGPNGGMSDRVAMFVGNMIVEPPGSTDRRVSRSFALAAAGIPFVKTNADGDGENVIYDSGNKSETELKTLSTFTEPDGGIDLWSMGAGWEPVDTGSTWGICSQVNDGFPFLVWQFTQDPCVDAPVSPPETPPAAPVVNAPVVLDGPVLGEGDVLPRVNPGAAERRLANGTSVPLTLITPAAGVLQIVSDEVRVTFTGAPGTSPDAGVVAVVAEEIVCEVCVRLAVGSEIQAWLFSTPTFLGSVTTSGDECHLLTLSLAGVTPGDHTLQLAWVGDDGVDALNIGVSVVDLTSAESVDGAPVPTGIPAGEGPQGFAVWLFAFLIASIMLLAARRRRAARANI